jgi:hypothetical protein
MEDAKNDARDPDGQQFETGSGDYTAERHRWLGSLTFEDLMRDIERMRQRDSTSGTMEKSDGAYRGEVRGTISVRCDAFRWVPAQAIIVARFTAAMGPAWMFVPGCRSDLELVLGRQLGETELLGFRTNPRKAEESIQMLENAEARKATTAGTVASYRLGLTHEGRKGICRRHSGVCGR